MGRFLLPAYSLCRREIVRFLRQRSRIIGAFAAPLMFWFLIGSGLGDSFRPAGATENVNYLEYFFPGTIAMILLFTAIFATISLIEDRNAGFLQAVLASPASRASVVVGKVGGGAVLALGHAMLFLVVAPWVGVDLTVQRLAVLLPVMFLVGFGLTTLGFIIAWRMESIQGFHAIMNMFLLPLWLLSGALFPASGATSWVKVLMNLNPLTYGLAAIRHVLYPTSEQVTASGPAFGLSLTVTAVVTFALCVYAVVQAHRPRAGGLV